MQMPFFVNMDGQTKDHGLADKNACGQTIMQPLTLNELKTALQMSLN